MIEFFPNRFNFNKQDIRRVGSVTSGGTSLSGIEDPIETDGGGFWRADYGEGQTVDRADGLEWRRITEAMDNGSAPVNVRLSERRFQPVGRQPNPLNPEMSPGAVATVTSFLNGQTGGLRATKLRISIASEKPLLGGELFSVNCPTWGHRAHRIIELVEITAGSAYEITIRPGLREAIPIGTSLDFDSPRCLMRLAAITSNETMVGKYTACAISFVEDMRKPA